MTAEEVQAGLRARYVMKVRAVRRERGDWPPPPEEIEEMLDYLLEAKGRWGVRHFDLVSGAGAE